MGQNTVECDNIKFQSAQLDWLSDCFLEGKVCLPSEILSTLVHDLEIKKLFEMYTAFNCMHSHTNTYII